MTKSVIFLAALAIVTAQQTPAPASGVAHGEPINVVFKAVSQAEVFRPTTGKPGTWPGIVLVSDDTGLDDFLRARALNFASKGFLVVAVDTRPATPASMSEELRNKRVIEELGGAVSYLNSWMITPNRVAIVGYGTGGTLALNFALADDSVRAVVLNYAPMRVESPGVTEAHFALLANLGDLDPSTPTTQTAQAIAKLHALRVTTTVKRYPDAGHRFDRDGEAAYDAHDANDQQTRTIAFISNHLGQANSH